MEERFVAAALPGTVALPKVISSPRKSAPVKAISRTVPFLVGRERAFKRVCEIAPAAITWFIISMLFWGGLVMPTPVALAVIAFDLYWFSRSFSAAFHGIQGYWRVKATDKIDWRDEYSKALDDGKVLVAWEDVHHAVVIPNFRERPEKLRKTLEYLAAQDDASWQMTVVLAM